ncbi:6540_t:CDS:2, partial [Racocetra persica]
SNYIPQIQDFISLLVKNGSAYQRTGEIFFWVEDNPEYGRLSGQNLAKLKERTREITSANKENKRDFTIDIHGGGNDLLFPHHENERIQYLAANN